MAQAKEKLLYQTMNHNFVREIGPSLAKKYDTTEDFSHVPRMTVQYTNCVKMTNDYLKPFEVTGFTKQEQKGMNF